MQPVASYGAGGVGARANEPPTRGEERGRSDMVRVALAAFRLACVVVLYIFLYRVCRVLVLDASSDGASHSTSIEQVFNHRSAEDSPDAGVDDVV
jgi:hypothetical protein